jgi:hypothetical protein
MDILRVDVGVDYCPAFYYGWADWNLREDFTHPKSFEHVAVGHGLELSGGIGVGGRVRASVEAVCQLWATAAGIDRTFFSSGAYSETRLNGVRGRSFRLHASLVLPLTGGDESQPVRRGAPPGSAVGGALRSPGIP